MQFLHYLFIWKLHGYMVIPQMSEITLVLIQYSFYICEICIYLCKESQSVR